MDPVWMVAIGITVLAALPHQLPIHVSFGLTTTMGSILFGCAAVAVGWQKPVLGMAMFILLASTNYSNYVEGFQNILKDKVDKKKLWASENIMQEEPEGIQERTDAVIVTDEVKGGSHHWFSEDALGEEPQSIQERSTPTEVYQESSPAFR